MRQASEARSSPAIPGTAGSWTRRAGESWSSHRQGCRGAPSTGTCGRRPRPRYPVAFGGHGTPWHSRPKAARKAPAAAAPLPPLTSSIPGIYTSQSDFPWEGNMAEQLIVKNLPFIKVLPAWAQELSYKYCSKTANLYLLSGNIRDFLPHKMKEGEFNFVKIQDYVSEVLFGNRDIIVFYDRSSGVSFCKPEMKRDYLAKMKQLSPQGHPGQPALAQPRAGARRSWSGTSTPTSPTASGSSSSSTTRRPSCPTPTSPATPTRTATAWSPSTAGRTIPSSRRATSRSSCSRRTSRTSTPPSCAPPAPSR